LNSFLWHGTIWKPFYSPETHFFWASFVLQLDPLGIAIIAVQIAGFLLLLVGVYPSKQREESANLVKHGLLSTAAVAVNLVTVFAAMIPVFSKIVINTSGSGFAQFPVIWLHAAVGAVTIGSSIIMIASWITQPLSELGCAKRWRLMKPTLIVWALAIALGAFIQIYGLI
jgi:hypothetical protein